MIARSSASLFASTLPDPSKSQVADVLADLGKSQLEFFDDLEMQSLVCHDDALHAALLMGAAINSTDYRQRLDMAARLGWISPAFDRPALEAATVGEVCRLLVRLLDQSLADQANSARNSHQTDSHQAAATLATPPSLGNEALSQDQAVARLSSLGALPADLKVYQGITGAQYLSVLGSVHDAITAPQNPSPSSAPSSADTAARLAAASTPATLTASSPTLDPVEAAVATAIADLSQTSLPADPPLAAPPNPAAAASTPASASSAPYRPQPGSMQTPTPVQASSAQASSVQAVDSSAVSVTTVPDPVPASPDQPRSQEPSVSESPGDPAPNPAQFRPGTPVKKPDKKSPRQPARPAVLP